MIVFKCSIGFSIKTVFSRVQELETDLRSAEFISRNQTSAQSGSVFFNSRVQ